MPKKNSAFFERIQMAGRPLANASSVIVSGQARFTVLTSRLIRLEWAADSRFEDRPTFAFPTRYMEKHPAFTCKDENGVVEIKTADLTLCYRADGHSFNSMNLILNLTVNGKDVEWKPGTDNPGNLRGTRRTLDQFADAVSLDEGLLSQDGWSLFDDSGSVVWGDDQTWVEGRSDEHVQDWYFFGYGHDYKALLSDYIQFGGKVPLVPRYVLGLWWSRFWAYHADDLKQLVNDFAAHEIPLDVLVVDMDWHTPDGWTGYTWNRNLFPDPEAFIRWVHEQRLSVTLNLHPAEGVQKHEEAYPAFAKAMGIDPETGEGVAFNSTDKIFIEHYFGLLHHPMEEQGVDFWWVDWQQGTDTSIKNLDPLPWLNHLHFRDATRRGTRPMLYSRWGGLGNHRYPIGFSGDAYTTWESLKFQPYFTSTAANVGYGWWSHDIGGHFGAADPELYARWVQFGAVSPCLRLHSTKDPLAERRPWGFSDEVYQASKAAIDFRYQLFPYLYSAAHHATETGLSLCYPMYYEYPENQDAYLAQGQYFLGSELIAAPIVSPTDPTTGLAAIHVWIPEGMWYEYTTLETFVGPRWVHLYGDLNCIPLLAKAGAILPMSPKISRTQDFDGNHIILEVFPGAEGHFELYEDDGTTEAYLGGEYQTTLITLNWSESTATILISPAQGHVVTLPDQRTFELHLKAIQQPDSVEVNNVQQSTWSYDPACSEMIISLANISRMEGLEITVRRANGLKISSESRNTKLQLADAARLLQLNQPPASLENALNQVLTSLDAPIGIAARLGAPFVHCIDHVTYENARQQLGTLVIVPSADQSPFDVEISWTLQRHGAKTTFESVTFKACTTEQILHSPFCDEGDFKTFCWHVSVNLIWRGQPLRYEYHSADAYPSITRWETLINPETSSVTPETFLTSANNRVVWTDSRQTVNDNLKHPYGLILLENERERISSGELLEAYAATTISSETQQNVTFHLQVVGDARCYLNGVELTPVEPIEHTHLLPMFYSWMPPKQLYYNLPLKAGDNRLVVVTHPDRTINWWGVGGTLFDASGKVLI